MWKSGLSVLAVVSVLLVVGLGPSEAPATQPEEQGAKLRVGTYDNRAVTIAWFHSEFNDRAKLHEQMAEAKKAGDQAKIDELNELGPKLQRKLHFQGFGRSPVTDLLEPVKDRLGEVAAAAGVDAIVFECNVAAEGVEGVDVTHELVKLFNPTPEALNIIEERTRHDPVPLEDLRDED